MKQKIESRKPCGGCERFRAVIRKAVAVVLPTNRNAKNPTDTIPTRSTKR